MKARTRIERMKEFCYNPYVDLGDKTNFENLYVNSMKDFGREVSMIDYDGFDRIQRVEMNLEEMITGHQHILFWTGGKESYLTSKILDYYGVNYKCATFVESKKGGIDFSGGTDSFIKDGYLKPDIVRSSSYVADFATNSWGSSVPIIYLYVLDLIKSYPGCVIWIGSEYTSCLARYKIKFALDQSDLMFSEINNDNDIFGSVYSIVNCLREFDIYRIVRKEFDYDPKYSCYNQGKKKIQRIGIWEKYMNFLDEVDSADDRDFIRMELNHLPLGIRLFQPIVYDFRKNVAEFLRTLKSFDRYSVG